MLEEETLMERVFDAFTFEEFVEVLLAYRTGRTTVKAICEDYNLIEADDTDATTD